MAFKMKGFQAHSNSPMKKGPITWIKSKVKQGLDYIDDKTVNMAPIDKETQAIRDQDAKNQAARTKALQNRTAKDKITDAAKQKYKDSYMTDPIGKQRDNEDDEQYARRMADITKHKQAYADKRYAEDQARDKAKKEKALSSKTPKTKEQSTKTKKKNFVTIDKKEKSNKA